MDNRIQELLKEKRGALIEPEVMEILSEYAITVPRSSVVKDLEGARKAAAAMGYPVVLKVVSRDILHKSEAGGVAVDLGDGAELEDAWNEMRSCLKERAPSADIEGFLVEEMVPRGVEVIVGALRDEQFGPAVMFGSGGTAVELFKDVSFRLAPVGREEALEMMRECRGYPLLTGFRGAQPCDVEAVADVITKLSSIMCELDRLKELEINPLVAYPDGVVAVDARATLVGGE